MAISKDDSLVGKGDWPELPLAPWRDTLATVHRYTQVVGKVCLALAPHANHWWQVALHVTAHGLRTPPLPFAHGVLDAEFDFLDHELRFRTSGGRGAVLGLDARPVAEFYRDVMATLRTLGVDVRIWDVPVEIPDDRTRFRDDLHHHAYDREAVGRFFQALVRADAVMREFRGRFTGKASPVHFFWGSFDLAATRYSGRPALPRPGADPVTLEAYSEEASSVGFWPGSGEQGFAAFYAYAAPAPEGFAKAAVRPREAFYDQTLGEYLLRYDDVRRADDPRQMLLDFFQSTYEAAAELGGWDRDRLERPLVESTERKAAEAGFSAQ